MIKQLKDWLARPGNTKPKLAVLLELKSTQTIENWLFRKSVPKKDVERLKKVLEEN